MAERERTIVTHALYRLNDPVFVAALSPRDRSSISQPVAHFCRDQETEMSSTEEEEGSGNHHNWPGRLGLINVSLSCTKYLRYSYISL